MPESWKECEGQIVDGRFPLVEHLGGSDHSVVFRTQRKNSQEKAAIKFVPANPATADAQLARWKSAAQLSHPNLIKLYESGRCHLAGIDLLYVVMDHASENLAEFLPHRALSPAETRDMLEPFIETLSYLHGKGYVHGNIRPGNILAIDDQLKLSSDSIRRASEPRLGTAKADAYAAPESTQGKSAEPADVWSLGVTLVEALTQRVPEGVASSASGQSVTVPESLPQPFLDIARHSLQTNPQQRWTIADISQKLNPKAAPPPPPPAPTVSQSIPAAVKPTAPQAKSAPKDAAPPPVPPAPTPRKPAASVDPLSVPLSTVALDHQVIAGKKSSGGGYYLVVAVILALTIGALLMIPRFRGSQSEPGASTSPSQPSTPSAPTNSSPVIPAKPQPKIEQKPPSSRTNQPQRSALEPTPDPKHGKPDSKQTAQQAQDLQQTATAQPSTQKERTPSPTAAPASLKSPVSRSDSPREVEAAPFVADREASIKSGAVTPGEVLNQILPEISDKSRSTIHGTVRSVIKVHVGADGSVSSAEVASGPSRFFSTAALDAAKRWDFAPAKIDGHAVPSEWLLHFDFTSSDTKVTPLATKP